MTKMESFIPKKSGHFSKPVFATTLMLTADTKMNQIIKLIPADIKTILAEAGQNPHTFAKKPAVLANLIYLFQRYPDGQIPPNKWLSLLAGRSVRKARPSAAHNTTPAAQSVQKGILNNLSASSLLNKRARLSVFIPKTQHLFIVPDSEEEQRKVWETVQQPVVFLSQPLSAFISPPLPTPLKATPRRDLSSLRQKLQIPSFPEKPPFDRFVVTTTSIMETSDDPSSKYRTPEPRQTQTPSSPLSNSQTLNSSNEWRSCPIPNLLIPPFPHSLNFSSQFAFSSLSLPVHESQYTDILEDARLSFVEEYKATSDAAVTAAVAEAVAEAIAAERAKNPPKAPTKTSTKTATKSQTKTKVAEPDIPPAPPIPAAPPLSASIPPPPPLVPGATPPASQTSINNQPQRQTVSTQPAPKQQLTHVERPKTSTDIRSSLGSVTLKKAPAQEKKPMNTLLDEVKLGTSRLRHVTKEELTEHKQITKLAGEKSKHTFTSKQLEQAYSAAHNNMAKSLLTALDKMRGSIEPGSDSSSSDWSVSDES
ncbi:hypothetical protein BLNAU_19204 [Blattamonas nauphoetae]|uniref:WH2 domain-containing protein n=1 Tax=Blattamonas nauphoetae TaxID=2049346 RepID=A0ABQ9X2B3_9EUKA|nr:hypothetical protein BLNAU_19204 [Blattamonas nauphoetae]